jgi:CheY-like chemotaxis protein
MSAPSMYQVVLRAQIESDSGPVVTNTTALSESRVVLAVEIGWDVGRTLQFQLSFPGLLESQSFAGRVLDVREVDQPEPVRLVEIGFEFRGEKERRYIGDLVARVRESGVFRAAPEHAGNAEYRVLLVEDNPIILELFSYGVDKYFRQKSATVQVDFAEDFQIAWEMFRAVAYDLAIVDHFLPLSTGAHLIARMRHHPTLQAVPVIAISVGGPAAREACLQAGADLFLDKPIVLRDLFTTLARLTAPPSLRSPVTG